MNVDQGSAMAAALEAVILPKLQEVGWGTGGPDDQSLAEYIVLMLVNGKSQSEIAAELAGELLSLSPDDPGARDFAEWLFTQARELGGQRFPGQGVDGGDASTSLPPGEPSNIEIDTDMATSGDAAELNA